MKIPLLVSLIVCVAAASFAQEVATTESGKHVRLNADGTWSYIDDEAMATSARDVLKAFLDAPSAKERLKLSAAPEKDKPVVERLLPSSEPVPYDRITVEYGDDEQADTATMTVLQHYEKKGTTRTRKTRYYLLRTKAGYRVDVRSSLRYNRVTACHINTSEKPTKSFLFRAMAEPGYTETSPPGFWGSFYATRANYYILMLRDIDECAVSVVIPKKMKGARELWERVTAERSVLCVVELRFRTPSEDKRDEMASWAAAFPGEPYYSGTRTFLNKSALVTRIVSVGTTIGGD